MIRIWPKLTRLVRAASQLKKVLAFSENDSYYYGMSALVIELTPSLAGWYYPASPPISAPRRRARTIEAPPPSRVSVVSAGESVDLGYGPDGRPRRLPSQAMISYLA
jgi:hypothetical protein